MHRVSGRTVAVAVVAASLLILAACGDDGDGSASSGTTTTTTVGTTTTGEVTTTTGGGAASTATVAIRGSSLGDILVDSAGMTLYVWDNDTTPGTSSCTGACATAWPPLMATGTPTYGAGLDASMFSTVTRDDGSTQLAVNDHPLYLWAADQAPGDTTGQGVNGFYVVAPNGTKIT
jgi:predicted lipoprotein with Yx(FWY)xxD motif